VVDAYHALMSDLSVNQLVSTRCLFSIDVEDWFHILDIPSAPAPEEWDRLPSRIENNFHYLLEILAENQIKCTCFFLGWIAERYPHLVMETVAAGHEIASHGYSHRLVYQMTQKEFSDDEVKAKKLLEDISGKTIIGYRASGFSVTEATPWFFESLAKAGYRYDSSVFPASRGHGGIKSQDPSPRRIETRSGEIIEIPISTARWFGRRMSFFGGGYLRLFPYNIIRKKAAEVLRQQRPVNFYIHPREIDPDHPRLPMNPVRRFKSYVNLSSVEPKITRLIEDFDWMTFLEYINEYFPSRENI
jgi:polysaccharide deacetylase family protein (PEP-CTERM system associated)